MAAKRLKTDDKEAAWPGPVMTVDTYTLQLSQRSEPTTFRTAVCGECKARKCLSSFDILDVYHCTKCRDAKVKADTDAAAAKAASDAAAAAKAADIKLDVARWWEKVESYYCVTITAIRQLGNMKCTHEDTMGDGDGERSFECSSCGVEFDATEDTDDDGKTVKVPETQAARFLRLATLLRAVRPAFDEKTAQALFHLHRHESGERITKITNLGTIGCSVENGGQVHVIDDSRELACDDCDCSFEANVLPENSFVRGGEAYDGRVDRYLRLLREIKFPVVCLTERKEKKHDIYREVKIHLLTIENTCFARIKTLVSFGDMGCDHGHNGVRYTNAPLRWTCKECEYAFDTYSEDAKKEDKMRLKESREEREKRYVAVIEAFIESGGEVKGVLAPEAAAPAPAPAAAAAEKSKTVVRGKHSRA